MSTQLTEQKKDRLPTIRDRLRDPSMIAELGKAMPEHCKPERMARVALTAITRIPKLAECDQASFFRCLLDLSAWGLEPDGRRAHLIPFENKKRGITEVQLIIDYKGLVELAYRSGVVASIHADVVCENDDFEYDLGEIKRHRIDLRKERGTPYAAYARVVLKDGTTKCEVLSRDEVESIRRRSRAANNGPWVTDWSEMAKKSAFRRVSKWLPLSADIHEAFERDDDRPEPIAQQQQTTVTTASLDSLAEMLTSRLERQPPDEPPAPEMDEHLQDQEVIDTDTESASAQPTVTVSASQSPSQGIQPTQSVSSSPSPTEDDPERTQQQLESHLRTCTTLDQLRQVYGAASKVAPDKDRLLAVADDLASKLKAAAAASAPKPEQPKRDMAVMKQRIDGYQQIGRLESMLKEVAVDKTFAAEEREQVSGWIQARIKAIEAAKKGSNGGQMTLGD